MEALDRSRFGITPAKTEQLRRFERDIVCSIFDDSMISGVDVFGRTVSATSDSTGIPVSPLFGFPPIAILGKVSPRRGPRINLMKLGLARLQKLPQHLVPDLTGFFPGAKLTA
jgi:hypothetical protein